MHKVKMSLIICSAFLFILTRCSCEDDPTSSSDNPFAKLAGQWKMTSFYYQSIAEANLMVDLVQLGHITLSWDITEDGNYSYSGTSMGSPFSGTEKFDGSDDDIDDGDTGTVISLDGDELMFVRQNDFYDFGNGYEAAKSTQIFIRQ